MIIQKMLNLDFYQLELDGK